FAEAWNTLLDDLNVPGALGGVFSKIKEADQTATDAATAKANWMGLWFMLDAFGLTLPEDKEESEVPTDILELAAKRWEAKANKDWAAADALRKELEAAGWLIKDSKTEYSVVPKT
ncbi:MAG: cyss: cysteine--trna ligase, partial [Verrucomicrobiaceae bacterium]|nr:cyss: cysteine--trna ligase [Verrucomicrobiaceae bacterium]